METVIQKHQNEEVVPLANQLPMTWDLDTFFPGGSQSPELARHLDKLESSISLWHEQVQKLPTSLVAAEAFDRWQETMEHGQEIFSALGQSWAFVGCLMAQDVKDREAKILNGRLGQVWARLDSVLTHLDDQITKVSDADWARLLKDERLAPLAFPLDERRRNARDKMEPAKEILATDLAVDGLHAWETLYDTVVGRITIPLEGENLSVGQAYNKFSEPDRALRAHLFAKWEEAWGKEAELCAASLNSIAGFRLARNKHRGWESILKEPLEMNRMTEKTLFAMWDAVSTSKGRLVAYMKRKAKLLGWESFNWHDMNAPLGAVKKRVSYDEAADFITDHFRAFSPRMAEFAQRAFRNRWIEAEDRPGKAPGGFCTGFEQSAQSRIFMTYGGDQGSVGTLAHELGHAYHSEVMFDLPPLARNYAMNVAETASTFAEMLIGAAAIKQASTKEERLALLDAKIGEAIAYLMNIHARFIFELKFYDARKKGPVSIDRLNEMMVEAQKEGFSNGLGEYHPLFWASKGHFYGTNVPFYNFPYTFGYLFSSGLYARAVEEGPRFEQKYVDLLRDTGRMTVEDLASRHLGVDLTRPEFWVNGVDMAMQDVVEFLSLTESEA